MCDFIRELKKNRLLFNIFYKKRKNETIFKCSLLNWLKIISWNIEKDSA